MTGSAKLTRIIGYALLTSILCACDVKGKSSTTELFISRPATQSVIRFDAAEGKILKETVVGMLPHNMLLSQDKRKLYVVLAGSQAIAEMDVASGDLLRTFLTEPVPTVRADKSVIKEHAEQDAFSRSTCYDCHRGGGSAKVSIIGSRPFGMVFSADGKTLFVCNSKTGNLSVIDVASGKLEKLVPLPPSGVATEPTDIALLNNQLFVTLRPVLPSNEPGAVRRLDATTLKVLSETPTGPNAGVIVADTNNRQLFISNSETNTISRLDANGELMERVTVDTGPLGLRLMTEQKQMMVANYYANSISMVDLADSKAQTIPLSVNGKRFLNPTHISLDAAKRIAYVVSSGTVGNLLTFDLVSRQFINAASIGGLPFDVLTVPN